MNVRRLLLFSLLSLTIKQQLVMSTINLMQFQNTLTEISRGITKDNCNLETISQYSNLMLPEYCSKSEVKSALLVTIYEKILRLVSKNIREEIFTQAEGDIELWMLREFITPILMFYLFVDHRHLHTNIELLELYHALREGHCHKNMTVDRYPCTECLNLFSEKHNLTKPRDEKDTTIEIDCEEAACNYALLQIHSGKSGSNLETRLKNECLAKIITDLVLSFVRSLFALDLHSMVDVTETIPNTILWLNKHSSRRVYDGSGRIVIINTYYNVSYFTGVLTGQSLDLDTPREEGVEVGRVQDQVNAALEQYRAAPRVNPEDAFNDATLTMVQLRTYLMGVFKLIRGLDSVPGLMEILSRHMNNIFSQPARPQRYVRRRRAAGDGRSSSAGSSDSARSIGPRTRSSSSMEGLEESIPKRPRTGVASLALGLRAAPSCPPMAYQPVSVSEVMMG